MSHQQVLVQQYLTNTLPHAILINGAVGSGKLKLAQWLVELLSCQTLQKEFEQKYSSTMTIPAELSACGQCKTCLLSRNQSYPDHLLLDLVGLSIGIDEIRHANNFLEKTAHLGKFKTILIPQAELMTVAAANALLKTLEEPNPNSVILLITHDIELLLPTIISRCRLLTMKGQVGEALINQFSPKNSAAINGELNAFINLSHLPELKDKKVNKAYQGFKLSYIKYLTSAQIRNKASEALLKLLCEQDHSLRWLEKITVNLSRESLLNVCSISTTLGVEQTTDFSKPNVKQLNKLYKTIMMASKVLTLSPQVNKTLVFEKLHLALRDIANEKH